MKKRVVLRLKGGLGNQLFMYAAAFSFCRKNGAELLVDGTTGFWADKKYQRTCRLGSFNVSARIFFFNAYWSPIAFWGLKILKAISRIIRLSFYVDQSNDEREISRIFLCKYIEGYWQSESYFSEFSSLIKSEFALSDIQCNKLILNEICEYNSVGIHVRFFSESVLTDDYISYYKNAIEAINKKVQNPIFYIFSDSIYKTKELFSSLIEDPKFVDVARSELEDFLYLKSCKHFIGSDSTFFWWAAWLGNSPNKIVMFPKHLSLPKNFYPISWQGI